MHLKSLDKFLDHGKYWICASYSQLYNYHSKTMCDIFIAKITSPLIV